MNKFMFYSLIKIYKLSVITNAWYSDLLILSGFWCEISYH